MQTNESIIQMALNGQAQNGWAVFKLKKFSLVKELIFWGIFTLLFGGGIFLIFSDDFSNLGELNAGAIFMIVFTIILALWGLKNVIRTIKEFLSANNSVLVILDDKIVRSLGGKIENFQISEIQNLTLITTNTSIFGDQEIEIILPERGKITLADKKYFGKESDIFDILKDKVDSVNMSSVSSGHNNL